ncbi:MAG: hypothetical protein AAGJ29_00985 [Pseudomonadota bacterium]
MKMNSLYIPMVALFGLSASAMLSSPSTDAPDQTESSFVDICKIIPSYPGCGGGSGPECEPTPTDPLRCDPQPGVIERQDD